MCGVRYASLWINKDILTSRSKNGTANATGDYASATGNNYVNISGFTVENATSNLGWSVGKENNSQKGITLNKHQMQLQQIGFRTTETTASTAARAIPVNTTSSYPCVPIPEASNLRNKERKVYWAGFRLTGKDNLRDLEIREVNTMLSCKDESRGFFTYECEHCGTPKTVHFGCNSRICTNCGKNHTDKWAKSLGNALFNVPHRHAVLTIPDALWPIVRRNRFLHKVLMDAAIAAINDTISYKHRTHRPTFQEIPRGILRSSHKRIQNHKQTDEG